MSEVWMAGLETNHWDFCVASNDDLICIKKGPKTGTNKTEVHRLSAAHRYQKFSLQTGTGLHLSTASDFAFTLTNTDDLVCIKMGPTTGTSRTEVHILSRASNYQKFTLHTGTPLHITNHKEWAFVMDSYNDLICIKRGPRTGTNRTEVHRLSAAANYQRFNLQTGSGIHLTHFPDKGYWKFAMTKQNDLACIGMGPHTGTKKTEYHVLSRRSNYTQFIVHLGTALHYTDPQTRPWAWNFGIGSGNDLICIGRGPTTGSGKTEVHKLSCASNYGKFNLHIATCLHLTASVVKTEDPGLRVPEGCAVPAYWANRDLSSGFDERVDVEEGFLPKLQELLDATFKVRATSDRSGRMPSRLKIRMCHRIEDARMWIRYFEAKKDLEARNDTRRLADEYPDNPVKTCEWAGSTLCGDDMAAQLRTLTAGEHTSEIVTVPTGFSVRSAFYGCSSREQGADVTAKVCELIAAGTALSADNNLFGDPAPGKVKTLFVDVAKDAPVAQLRTLAATERTGETVTVPTGCSVRSAFYGCSSREQGADVTAKVRELIAAGIALSANNSLFGDPAPGKVKTLFVDVAKDVPGAQLRTLTASEHGGDIVTVPKGASVQSAFYGCSSREQGADVTAKVWELIAAGTALRADNSLFGDPVPGIVKTLFVDVAQAPAVRLRTLAASEHEGEIVTVPKGASVQGAFYGCSSREQGADVTAQVRELVAAGTELRADNSLFGDPAPGVVKTLFVDVAEGGLDDSINEFFLMHGSSPAGVIGISNDGFRRSLAGTNAGSMFTAGCYLAECCSKADEYARTDDTFYEGLCAILLCRTACGQLFRVLKPDDEAIEAALESGDYDSVLGDREAAAGTYREFVIFNECRIYPEYVLLYERLYEKPEEEGEEDGEYETGYLSQRMREIVEQGTEGDEDKIRDIFREWDADGDGIITKLELVCAMAAVCEGIKPNDIEALVEECDRNGDGAIDYEEFLAFLGF